jgi:DNA-binding transcriptional MerR regulator
VARPKERPFARTEELLEITKVTRRSLYEWVKLGVLPAPRVMSDGNGVYSRWPKVAIDHAHFIVEQRALGYALDEIRPMVHARWGSADKVPIEEALAYEKKVAEARHARHAKKRKQAGDEAS